VLRDFGRRRVLRVLYKSRLTLCPLGPGTESPRPLSKIRTNFIAIEKDGRVGLQLQRLEGSQDSGSVLRSGVTTPTASTERLNPFDTMIKSPPRTSLLNQTISDSPQTVQENKESPSSQGQPSSKPDTSAAPAANGTKESSPEKARLSQPQTTKATESNGGKDQKPAEREPGKTSSHTSKPTPKPIAVSSATKSAPKALKSPINLKGPKSPGENQNEQVPVKKTPDKKPHPPEKSTSPRASTTSVKTSTSVTAKKSSSVTSSPHTSFVKPKPKSPTRPVKLPPSLTSHTAASGSKVTSRQPSLSRPSGSAATTGDSHGRPSSRASVITNGSVVPKSQAPKRLRRQSSTINRPRPSLGPPPKQPAKDHPPTKKEKPVDEGFLARMTRPTQASASRAAEKAAHITATKKPVAAAAPKKTVTTKTVKKPASKPTSAASSSTQPQSSTTDKPKVEAEPASHTPSTKPDQARENKPDQRAETTQQAPAAEVNAAPESDDASKQEPTASDIDVANESVETPQSSEATAPISEDPEQSVPQPAAEAPQAPDIVAEATPVVGTAEEEAAAAAAAAETKPTEAAEGVCAPGNEEAKKAEETSGSTS